MEQGCTTPSIKYFILYCIELQLTLIFIINFANYFLNELLLVLSNKQSEAQRYSVYCHISQRKAANPHKRKWNYSVPVLIIINIHSKVPTLLILTPDTHLLRFSSNVSKPLMLQNYFKVVAAVCVDTSPSWEQKLWCSSLKYVTASSYKLIS